VVITLFKTLIEGSDIADGFKLPDGSWDERALDNYYTRRVLGDHPVLHTGGQNPLDVNRGKCCTADNVLPSYDDIKAALLVRAKRATEAAPPAAPLAAAPEPKAFLGFAARRASADNMDHRPTPWQFSRRRSRKSQLYNNRGQ